MPDVYLFDLDMTLVDSSALEDLRRRQLWQAVKGNLRLVRAFPPQPVNGIAPHDLPRLAKEKGAKVAIVTSSPNWYADEIVKTFGIPHDALVAYGDTEQHKPDPAPLQEALKRLGVAAGPNVYYVGDDAVDVEAAFHAGLTSIGVRWGQASAYGIASAAPDIFVRRASRVLAPAEFPKLRYVGEAILDGGTFTSHWGTILRSNEVPRVYALGRYFTRSDPRHAKSKLSAAILSLKDGDDYADQLGKALSAGLATRQWRPDFVVPVPPKPSQDRKRFSKLLKAAKPDLPKGSEIKEDGLRVIKEVANYKNKGPLERQAAISGAFASKYDWGGHKVLVIDDVYTTGETINECIRALRKDGAGEVRCFVIGKDQRTFGRKLCPKCGRSMKVRTNAKSGEKFWGCSGYPDECKHTMSM